MVVFDSNAVKMMRSVSFAVCVLLSGCQSSNHAGAVRDSHTGTTVVHSKKYVVSGDMLSNTKALAAYSTRKGFNVSVQHMSTGRGWHFFRQAWSQGKRYPYTVNQEKVLSCASGCTMLEGGLIKLSGQQFQEAAKTGFSFRLTGKGGSIAGTVPPSAFREVLSRLR